MSVSRDGRSLCHKAEEYYYELLCHDDAGVPEAIVRHVGECPSCQEQIRRLGGALSEPANDASRTACLRSLEAVEALSQQLEFLDKPVDCSSARPFLPELLIPSRQIKIPTPITVHVDNCPECAGDLASLGELSLTADQLKRLSEFYRGPSRRLPARREQTRPTAAQDDALACVDISLVDLFDYIMPPDGDDVATGSGERRHAVAAHLRTCGRCTKRTESLGRLIRSIAERADSPVSTVCRTDEEAGETREEAEIRVCRYPMRAEIRRGEPVPAGVCRRDSTSLEGARGRLRAAWATRLRPFSRVAVVAVVAAVVVIGLSRLPWKTQTAEGTSINDLIAAVDSPANVVVAKWIEGVQRPIMEMLVSRDLGVVVRKTGANYTRYDLGLKLWASVRADGERGLPLRMSGPELENCRTFMDRPMEDIFAGAPVSQSLSPLSADVSDPAEEDLQVYEIARPITDSRTPSYRWTVYVDPRTQLPTRIERVYRGPARFRKSLKEVVSLWYPSKSEMEDLVKGYPLGE